MSDISSVAEINAFIADYAIADAVGKLNVIGGGITLIGHQPGGATAPFTVLISVAVPARFAGQEYALTVELINETTGRHVSVPSNEGPPQVLRAQQVVTVPPLQIPQGFKPPPDAFVAHNVAMGFPTGIPLPAGNTFDFRVQIDGNVMPKTIRFHILKPDPGPVLGGPSGPGAIPGVGAGPFGKPTP
jgi:hypothetical protein